MRDPGREVPQVSLADVVRERSARLIDRRDAGLALQHIRPLGFLVPMKLADRPRLETHVYTPHGPGDGPFADRRPAGPTSFLDPDVTVRERALQVRHGAAVGSRWTDREGILSLAVRIAR